MPAPRRFTDVTLLPVVRGRGRIGAVVSRFGAVDGSGARLPKWPLLTSLDTSFALNLRRPGSAVEDHIPEAIFGGLYYNWFGHFLTETLPNLVAAAQVQRANPDLPIVCFVPDNRREAEVYPAPSDLATLTFETLGLDPARLRFVRQPTGVGTLLMGPAPFPRKHRYAPWLLRALDDLFPQAAPDQPARDIYVSRSRWTGARTPDEPRVEDTFRAAGYDIVHMETLSLAEQFATIRSATHVAGCTGTALHWSLYGPSCKSVIALGYRTPLQKGISLSRGQRFLNPPGRRVKGAQVRVRDFTDRELERAIATARQG